MSDQEKKDQAAVALLDRDQLGPAVKAKVTSLVDADSPRLAGESLTHARVLADLDGELPPIIVNRRTSQVIDGMHRLRAAQLRGDDEITVQFFDGDESDAFVLAVQTNIAHGLPLSLADRKTAATRILASHPRWSDRLTASVTGLAARTIAELRRRGTGAADHDDYPGDQAGPAADQEIRIGQDGRVRPVSSAEGRRIAGRLMTEDPSLSLRQVARAAAISPETARDVRRRLRRGEDPVLPGRGRHGSGADQHDQPDHAGQRSRLDDQPVIAPTPLHQPSPADPAVALNQLKRDPALRFNEQSRMLLRLLDANTMPNEQWSTIVDSVPAHSRGKLADAAQACAARWQTVADRMARQPRAS